MNRIDRLTGTLLMLQSQSRLSAGTIASHWEISERTVYRDIAALSEAGVPVVFEPGDGYRLLGGYEMPPVMFSENEALALFLAGEITERIADISLRKSLRSALTKIRSVLPQDRRELFHDFKKSLGLWLYTKKPTLDVECLIPIHNAVLHRQCMTIGYDTASRGIIRERVVEPLGILYYGDHWHLVAYCRYRQDYRDFRMDRVVQWEVSDIRFEGHQDFSIDAFLNRDDGEENMIPVLIEVHPKVLKRLKSQMYGDPMSEVLLKNGWIRLEFLTVSIDWCVNWFLSFGANIKVLEPHDLVRNIGKTVSDISKYYPNEGELERH